ncbi:MAG: laccase domain-containing protein [Deltaproteobacteria bacterium]|nr:laccase domain-containing protein [Deltaproteobacteria bacterium]MBW2299781.1 laccase domain-containing protein [Deltaproteobacteria bacterium]
MLTKIAPIPPLNGQSLNQPFETTSPRHILYFQFFNLSKYGNLVHAVFSRCGGVSKSPFTGLNVSYASGDHKKSVNTNLRIIKKILGAERLVAMNQVHGRRIHVFTQKYPGILERPVSADAVITTLKHLCVIVKLADCQAIVILDPGKGVLANVHCGWRGNVANLPGAVVAKMKADFGCKPSDLIAGIGPSLGPCCAEFVTHKDLFPEHFGRFMVRENYFNLWEITKWQLTQAGIREENIEIAGICTRCRTDLFYSSRAEGVTGRFATAAMLK